MRLLVVEDDAVLREQVGRALQRAGHAVDGARDGIDGEHLGCVEPYDAIVLDLGLPGRDGLAVLRAWRAAGIRTPVLLLTARGNWQDKVQGMDAGADDYLAKPFHLEELLARLRALLRRAAGHAQAELMLGGVRLDTRACSVSAAGRALALTPHEYRLLSFLMHHAGRVVARSELAEHVYALDAERDSNTIDVFIARLRRKLPAGFIVTVRGLGYRVANEDGAG